MSLVSKGNKDKGKGNRFDMRCFPKILKLFFQAFLLCIVEMEQIFEVSSTSAFSKQPLPKRAIVVFSVKFESAAGFEILRDGTRLQESNCFSTVQK